MGKKRDGHRPQLRSGQACEQSQNPGSSGVLGIKTRAFGRDKAVVRTLYIQLSLPPESASTATNITKINGFWQAYFTRCPLGLRVLADTGKERHGEIKQL